MTGSEVFSFIPQELLPNLATLYDNSADVSLVYGMDGPLTTWINDANGNNSLADGGDFVYLYQGMRRGGRNYYAYDVTNRAAPKLKWIIKGGTGAFTELAQTWSSAVKTRIKLNGVDKTVLIFGGGYDTAQDSNNAVQNDSVGRAVFIVDADTGAKLWQAGPAGSGATLTLSGMNYSIPSDVTIIDTNGDGYADRMYVGDMGAQIWRFDINKSNTGASNLATGGILARLGDNTPEGNRRFYYAPDVSLAKSGTHFNIAIGSGYREHPLDTVIHDAFFIVRDPNVYGPSRDAAGNAVYTTVTLNDMYDATSNLIGQGTAAQVTAETTLLATKKGWYIWLRSSTGSFIGEKVLAKSVTISDTVLFTTYTPTAAAPDSCSPSRGVSYLYYMNTKDGTPVDDHNSDNTLTAEDRKVALIRGGIHSTPALVVINDNDPSNPKPPVKCLADTESCGITPPQFSPSKTFWKVQ
jgi:type IV pilus assembly protein PilY1